ncbi:trypsin-like [Heteronotia binoei]|uniref:trypsin-like n=1 Tax=Heteronotia binoei TaxID=13085 RepID=UPI0029304A0E|nr:trypsin-like [Heteronotia binoei]
MFFFLFQGTKHHLTQSITMTALIIHAVILLLISSLVLAKSGSPPKGHPCVPYSQPWQAAVYKAFSFYCGAILLDRKWVLTAAHCKNGLIHVRLGERNLDCYDGTEQYKHVIKAIVHPGFNHSTHSNDLMLLKLMTPARLNCYVQPLGLSSWRASPGKMCLVSGWGAPINAQSHVPLVLYCANVKIVSHHQCEAEYPGQVSRKMVCAAALEGGTDSCEGDSGGPLVCDGKLQGVVSWGDVPCATSTKPGVYMDISTYEDWIKKTILEN